MPDASVIGDSNQSTAHAENHNEMHVEGISRVQAIILASIAGLGLGLGIFAEVQAVRAERETRMLEYYLLELDAKFIAAGLKPADESIAKKLENDQ